MGQLTILSNTAKNKIYKDLLDALLKGLESGKNTEKDAQESSGFILDNLEKITNQEELISFLETISNKWPVYHDVLLRIKEEHQENQDQQKIEDAREQIKNAVN